MFSTFSNCISQCREHATTLMESLPSLCPMCQLPQSGSLICQYCFSILTATEQGCFQCAEPLPKSIKIVVSIHGCNSPIFCGRCQNTPPWFDRVIAQLAYQEPLSKLIQGYKFANQLNLLPSLSECLIQQIQSVRDKGYQLPDALIAVPLHPQRLRQRGFNQSLLLANRVSKHLKIPLLNSLILRIKNTGDQASLNRKQRKSNIYKAFQISPSNKIDLSQINKIAIIDDVITSGNTCNELARILKKAGITFVDIWCIAKTPFIK